MLSSSSTGRALREGVARFCFEEAGAAAALGADAGTFTVAPLAAPFATVPRLAAASSVVPAASASLLSTLPEKVSKT